MSGKINADNYYLKIEKCSIIPIYSGEKRSEIERILRNL